MFFCNEAKIYTSVKMLLVGILNPLFAYSGAGKAKPDVVIVDKEGRQDTIKPLIKMINEDIYRVEYTPTNPGLHSVNVFYDRKHIPNSPFGVRVVGSSFPSRVRAWGRGLASRGVRVGDVADFKVSTEGAGDGKLVVHVNGPSKHVFRLISYECNSIKLLNRVSEREVKYLLIFYESLYNL